MQDSRGCVPGWLPRVTSWPCRVRLVVPLSPPRRRRRRVHARCVRARRWEIRLVVGIQLRVRRRSPADPRRHTDTLWPITFGFGGAGLAACRPEPVVCLARRALCGAVVLLLHRIAPNVSNAPGLCCCCDHEALATTRKRQICFNAAPTPHS